MSEYEPGTVAVATVNGKKNVRVMKRSIPSGHWSVSTGGMTRRTDELTDIRPLVVLDLDALDTTAPDAGETVAQYVVRTLRGPAHGPATRNAIADQIEAQTKPPRIPEPGRTGSIVKDSDRLWVKADDGLWICLSDGQSGNRTSWSFFVDPVLVRE